MKISGTDYLTLRDAMNALMTDAGVKMGYETVKEIARACLKILDGVKTEPAVPFVTTDASGKIVGPDDVAAKYPESKLFTPDRAYDSEGNMVSTSEIGKPGVSPFPPPPTFAQIVRDEVAAAMPEGRFRVAPSSAPEVPQRSLEIPAHPVDYYIERIWRILDEEPAEGPVPMEVKAGTLAALYQAKALQEIADNLTYMRNGAAAEFLERR